MQIRPETLFPAVPEDNSAAKFYKPSVKPKKMKIDQIFPVVSDNYIQVQYLLRHLKNLKVNTRKKFLTRLVSYYLARSLIYIKIKLIELVSVLID